MAGSRKRTSMAPEKVIYIFHSVISNWEYHKPSGVHQAEKDFKELNKLGIINGCTTAKVPTG